MLLMHNFSFWRISDQIRKRCWKTKDFARSFIVQDKQGTHEQLSQIKTKQNTTNKKQLWIIQVTTQKRIMHM